MHGWFLSTGMSPQSEDRECYLVKNNKSSAFPREYWGKKKNPWKLRLFRAGDAARLSLDCISTFVRVHSEGYSLVLQSKNVDESVGNGVDGTLTPLFD